MNAKTFSISIIPAILFTVGIIFFAYSPLTMTKAINVQNQVFVLFFDQLKSVDLLTALSVSFEYFFVNVLWVVIIFLLLESSGFLVYLYYLKNVDIRAVVASQVVMILSVLTVTNFSITMFLISLSLLVGTLWMHKSFEPEKKVFSTGYNVITSKIGLLSIFLAIGILLSLTINMGKYEKEMQQTNMDLIKNFMPDMSEAKDAQKKQVTQLADGLKYVVDERYNYLPEENKSACSSFYQGLNQSLDNYKEQMSNKIDNGNITFSEQDLLQAFPLFNLIVKATPVIIAISAYALLAVLTPVMGFFGGAVYSLVKHDKEDIQNKQ